jgi:hypothetical protein
LLSPSTSYILRKLHPNVGLRLISPNLGASSEWFLNHMYQYSMCTWSRYPRKCISMYQLLTTRSRADRYRISLCSARRTSLTSAHVLFWRQNCPREMRTRPRPKNGTPSLPDWLRHHRGVSCSTYCRSDPHLQMASATRNREIHLSYSGGTKKVLQCHCKSILTHSSQPAGLEVGPAIG